ncbi:hypothetical protein F9K82_19655 [Brucella pseudogrignonensis]|nr:hypothetical protein F9K82_19655 [Brucella pseudogrignonensis]
MIGFLRKNFPATITSETVKKYQLAPNNESYVINALQFIGLIDEEGKRTSRGHDVLLLPEGQFEEAFETLVREAYSDLFQLRGDDAWTMLKSELTGYFRATDKTSDVIGGRQANVFQALRVLSGKEEAPPVKQRQKANGAKPASSKTAAAKASVKTVVAPPEYGTESPATRSKKDMALTVRIEINLPAEGSQETYDNIFRSIKANLIDD